MRSPILPFSSPLSVLISVSSAFFANVPTWVSSASASGSAPAASAPASGSGAGAGAASVSAILGLFVAELDLHQRGGRIEAELKKERTTDEKWALSPRNWIRADLAIGGGRNLAAGGLWIQPLEAAELAGA